MSERTQTAGDLRLDFTFGPRPSRPEPLAALRWSDLRRRARRRADVAAACWRPAPPKHARWGNGLARLREV